MNRLFVTLLSVCLALQLLCVPCFASAALVDQAAASEHKKQVNVALALGGGGVRGAAHIGVLRVLEREGIPVDYVVGNSMGAVVGGLYCAGVPLDSVQRIMSDGSLIEAYLPHFLWCRIVFKPLTDLLSIARNKPYAGLVDGKRLKRLIDDLLPEPKMCVENLRLPFAAIAVSLIDGQAHVLSAGRISDVVRASATIPMLLQPVPIDGHLYVDGGVRNNLPTNEARHSGAKVVISVEIDSDMKPVPADQFKSFQTVFDRVVNATLEQLDEDKIHGADIVIRPALVNVPILSKDKRYVDEAVRQGELAAFQELPRIRKLLEEKGIEFQRAKTAPISQSTRTSLETKSRA
jgi:NTE family protein